MRIGNTPTEVRSALDSLQGARISRTGYYLDQYPVISVIERATLSTPCPRCNAKGWLCLSGTGLPASSPHQERILAAYQATGL